jgi:predicted ArsR family transcriptional regulator
MPDVATSPVFGAKRGPGKTRALVLKLKLQGRLPRDIAIELGVSTAAVYQHLANLRADGLLNDEKKAS